MANKKKNILILYGGRSTEHEISCRSAAFLLKHLDRDQYDLHAIAIDKQGRWLPQNIDKVLAPGETALKILPPSADTTLASAKGVTLGPNAAVPVLAEQSSNSADWIVFPMLHGTYGEDGTLQGMLDMLDAAYVGPDVIGSAIGIDKVVAKKLASLAGVPVVPYLDTRQQFWRDHADEICREAIARLGFPMFVKPARLGSSVGVSKVRTPEELRRACDQALEFDDRLLIEKGFEVREIECAVLGDYDPMVSVPGEAEVRADFFDYEAKYLRKDLASSRIPADLTPAQATAAQKMAKDVFVALELYGMARVDLFLEKVSGKFFFNEVNTIPGFTPSSQYPLLWQASGISHRDLLDRLINLAVKRRDGKRALKRQR